MADAFQAQMWNNNGWLVAGTASNHTLDANNDGIAWAFQPYSTDAITHLGYRYGARTGTPPTYSIRLEGLDTSGNPDNTDVGGGSATAKTFTPPASTAIDGTWVWQALTNSYTPTLGQVLCSTIRYSSGTVDGSNNSSFTRGIAGIRNASGASAGWLPANLLTAGTWAKSVSPPLFGWRTASGRFGFIGISSYATYTAGTVGHKSGMHFTLPSGHGTSFQLLGIDFHGDIGNAASTTKVGLWNTSGTELQSITLDNDFSTVVTAGAHRVIFNGPLATLTYGTKYYVGLEVLSGAVSMFGFNMTESDDRCAWPNGMNRGIVTYSGSWAETNTAMPACDLILNDITVAAGGGLLTAPGLNGRING